MQKFAMAAAVVLVMVSAVVAGVLTNRWGLSMSTGEAAARLAEVPVELEGWEVKELELDDAVVRQGEIAGYLHRRYVHRRTGAILTALVLCGRPGPISVHAPTVCYTNSGWHQKGTSKYARPGEPFAFDVLEMTKPSIAGASQLRLYLAMGSRGNWHVPPRPRVAYAGQASLFKVYIIQEGLRLGDDPTKGPATELIAALMPKLQEKLFPAGQ